MEVKKDSDRDGEEQPWRFVYGTAAVAVVPDWPRKLFRAEIHK